MKFLPIFSSFLCLCLLGLLPAAADPTNLAGGVFVSAAGLVYLIAYHGICARGPHGDLAGPQLRNCTCDPRCSLVQRRGRL